VKLLIEDIALFTQHRHLVGSLKYTSRGKELLFVTVIAIIVILIIILKFVECNMQSYRGAGGVK